MPEKKAASLVGIAQKAGKVASGQTPAEDAIRAGKAALVILAEDASENTKKRICDKAAWYRAPLLSRWKMTELGRMIGKADRAVLAILDAGIAKEIENHLNESR